MKKYICLIVFLLLFIGCKELYNEYSAALNEEYLVVEGMINDDPYPYLLELYKAIPFSNFINPNKDRPQPESGAVVIIKSDKGEAVMLHEIDTMPGKYITSQNEIQGEINHAYSLYIKTKDGFEYESLSSKINEKPVISGIEVEIKQKSFFDQQRDGTQKMISKTGMDISASFSCINKTSGYYKIDASSIAEFLGESIVPVIVCDTSLYPLICEEDFGCYRPLPPWCTNLVSYDTYCWYPYKDILPVLIASPKNEEKNTTGKCPVIFMPHLKYSDFTGNPLIGFIISIKAYELDECTFDYYRNIKNQLLATNKIFDPFPVQLTGNIKCVTQPKKKVFGVFIAASIEHKAFFVSGDGKNSNPAINQVIPVNSKDIQIKEAFNMLMCSDTYKPAFWRNKYDTVY